MKGLKFCFHQVLDVLVQSFDMAVLYTGVGFLCGNVSFTTFSCFVSINVHSVINQKVAAS